MATDDVAQTIDDLLNQAGPDDETWQHAVIESVGSGAIQTRSDSQYLTFGFQTVAEMHTVLDALHAPAAPAAPEYYCPHCERRLTGDKVLPIVAYFDPFEAKYMVDTFVCQPACGLSYLSEHRFSERVKAWNRHCWLEVCCIQPEDLRMALPRSANRRYLGGTVSPTDQSNVFSSSRALIQSAYMAPHSWIVEIQKQQQQLLQQPAPVEQAVVPDATTAVPDATLQRVEELTTNLRRPETRTVPVQSPSSTGEPPVLLNMLARRLAEEVQLGRTFEEAFSASSAQPQVVLPSQVVERRARAKRSRSSRAKSVAPISSAAAAAGSVGVPGLITRTTQASTTPRRSRKRVRPAVEPANLVLHVPAQNAEPDVEPAH